jgi:hypothetical protein
MRLIETCWCVRHTAIVTILVRQAQVASYVITL